MMWFKIILVTFLTSGFSFDVNNQLESIARGKILTRREQKELKVVKLFHIIFGDQGASTVLDGCSHLDQMVKRIRNSENIPCQDSPLNAEEFSKTIQLILLDKHSELFSDMNKLDWKKIKGALLTPIKRVFTMAHKFNYLKPRPNAWSASKQQEVSENVTISQGSLLVTSSGSHPQHHDLRMIQDNHSDPSFNIDQDNHDDDANVHAASFTGGVLPPLREVFADIENIVRNISQYNEQPRSFAEADRSYWELVKTFLEATQRRADSQEAAVKEGVEHQERFEAVVNATKEHFIQHPDAAEAILHRLSLPGGIRYPTLSEVAVNYTYENIRRFPAYIQKKLPRLVHFLRLVGIEDGCKYLDNHKATTVSDTLHEWQSKISNKSLRSMTVMDAHANFPRILPGNWKMVVMAMKVQSKEKYQCLKKAALQAQN